MTSTSLTRTHPTAVRTAAAGLATFVVATIAAGLLDPGYDPLREGVSALAATDATAAPVMIAGFLALAVGTMAAGIALWQRRRRVGGVLVLLAGAGMAVAAFARQDCSDFVGACAAAEQAGTLSGHHMLHQLVSLGVFTVLAIVPFFLARGFKASILAGVVGYGEYAGAIQRLVVLLLFGWPVFVAWRLDHQA
jgi:hypothetical protein